MSERELMRSRWIASGVMVSVALCGFLAGMAVDRRLVERGMPAPMPEAFGGRRPPGGPGGPSGDAGMSPRDAGDRMQRELGLSAVQRAAIDSIFAAEMQEMQGLMGPMRARADSLLARTRAAVESTLTPEQRRLLEARRREPPPPQGMPMR